MRLNDRAPTKVGPQGTPPYKSRAERSRSMLDCDDTGEAEGESMSNRDAAGKEVGVPSSISKQKTELCRITTVAVCRLTDKTLLAVLNNVNLKYERI